QILDRSVVDSERSTYAGLPRTAEYLTADPVGKSRRVCYSNARREVIPLSRREAARDARITRDHPALRSCGKLRGLQSGHDGLNLVLRVIPGLIDVPAEAVVDSYARTPTERVLHEQASVVRSGIQNLEAALR